MSSPRYVHVRGTLGPGESTVVSRVSSCMESVVSGCHWPTPGSTPGCIRYVLCHLAACRVSCHAVCVGAAQFAAAFRLHTVYSINQSALQKSSLRNRSNHTSTKNRTHKQQGPPPAGSGSRRGRRSSLPRAAPFLCAPCANAHHCARDCISRPIPHHRQRGRAASTTIAAAATASTASTASL